MKPSEYSKPDGSYYMDTSWDSEERAQDELDRLRKQYKKREDGSYEIALQYEVVKRKLFRLPIPINPF